MDVQFSDVFASKARGPGKPNHNAFIKDRIVARIYKRTSRCFARTRKMHWNKGFHNSARARSRNANYRDARAADTRSKRRDGAGFHVKMLKRN